MDIDYNEVFGLDPEELPEEGGNEQEVADPAGEEDPVGGKEQEVADPAKTPEETEPEEDPDPEEDDPSGAEDQEPEQDPEKRRENAARRRRAEQQAAIDEAVAKARQEAQAEAQRTIDEAFRGIGMQNPYTKTPITNKAEYDAYRARYDAERKAMLLKKSGMSEDEFQAFVGDLPEVRAANEAKAAAEAAAAQNQRENLQRRLDADVRAITALDPEIKTLADIAAQENYQDILKLVGNGNSLFDAYRLANFEKLAARQASLAEQAARNRTAGKAHLTPTTARGTGAPTLTQATIDAYRAIDPDVTLEEIRQYEAKYQKRQ